MTDKLIIIDGVDVSGCGFHCSHYEEDFDVKIEDFCSIVNTPCEKFKNCHFKQLARKTQECEKKRYKLS